MAEKAAIHLVEPAERAAAVAANKMERGGRPASAAATPTHLLSSLTSINESVWERQPREREERKKNNNQKAAAAAASLGSLIIGHLNIQMRSTTRKRTKPYLHQTPKQKQNKSLF